MTSSKIKIAQKLSINKNLLFCKTLFTRPMFNTFVGVIRSVAKNTNNGSLSALSQDVGKCISSIGYFFNDAKWDANILKEKIQNHMLRSKRTEIEEDDIACLDESAISKKGGSFQFIGEVWDNADKKVNSGYEYLAVAIVSTNKKIKWLFDYMFYSNKDKKFRGKPMYVRRILKRLFALTNIMMIVLDSGFKNKYNLKYIMNMGKNFIIRVEEDMVLWEEGHVNKRGHRYRFGDIKNMPGAQHYELEINGRSGWQITWARGIVNAWISQIKIPLTVIIIKHPVFRKPMILVTNIEPGGFLEAFEIYETYRKRWKIEEIFKSIKEMGLEKFRVRKLKAIMRYLTVMFVLHSLLTWQAAYFKIKIELKKLFEKMLKRKRKIKNLLVGGVKIFYELYLGKIITLNEVMET